MCLPRLAQRAHDAMKSHTPGPVARRRKPLTAAAAAIVTLLVVALLLKNQAVSLDIAELRNAATVAISDAASAAMSSAAATSTVASRADAELATNFRANWFEGEELKFVLQHDKQASFLFVEDAPEDGIDPIRGFLLRAEEHLRDLFHHLLYMPNCLEREQTAAAPYGAACAPESQPGKSRVVIDVGCNRGYYTFMAASYGHTVHAFDAQHHCSLLTGAAILMNGFSDTVKFTNAFVTNDTSLRVDVKRRTGCVGTFPNGGEWGERFRMPHDKHPGASKTVSVGAVSLDDLFSPQTHDVLLLKVDVEGAETNVFSSAEHLIEGGAVRNIAVELNVRTHSVIFHRVSRLRSELTNVEVMRADSNVEATTRRASRNEKERSCFGRKTVQSRIRREKLSPRGVQQTGRHDSR